MAYAWRVVGGIRRGPDMAHGLKNVDAVTCAFCRGSGRDRRWQRAGQGAATGSRLRLLPWGRPRSVEREYLPRVPRRRRRVRAATHTAL